MHNSKEKRRKWEEDDIQLKDLPFYIQKKAIPGAKVHILEIGRWKWVGNNWLLVKAPAFNMDDGWADVQTPLIHNHCAFTKYLPYLMYAIL
uniref:Uncharacterized protein n=1 Tax=candidate division WWE3 bacterium TaxID=2053526 RepID=A0A7C4XTG4_UNCKA